MKKSHIIIAIVLILISCSSYKSQAQQLSDIFSNALTHIKGFNLWASLPTYVALPAGIQQDGSIAPPVRVAFSLRYGPVYFGTQKFTTTSHTVISDTAKDITESGCKYCDHYIDSVRYEGKDDDISYHSRRMERRLGPCPSNCVTGIVIRDTSLDYEHSLSLNFGYNHTSSLGIKTDSGFKTAFPYGGFFISAIAPIYREGRLAIDLGVGGSIYELSDVVGTLHDTSSTVKMTAGATFSPEALLGFGFNCGAGFTIFLDLSYQYLRFGGLNYEVSGGSKQLNEIYSSLPHELNLSAFHVKFGITLDAKIGS